MVEVIVVTSSELGWDCVVGVFKDEESFLSSDLNTEEETPSKTLVEWLSANDSYVAHREPLQ